jgi:hypothetical protein
VFISAFTFLLDIWCSFGRNRSGLWR